VPVTPAAVVASQAGQVANAAAASMAGGGPMEALYGAMVRTAMIANEPVVSSKLLRAGEGGYMAVVLGPGMRAVSIPVTVTTAGGGFILPGDHVDLLQARRNDPSANGGHPPANGLDFTVSEVLRNVRVLAIDQSVAPAKGSESIVGAVATLEVPDGDTKAVAAAKAQGEITLVLRPFGDNSGPTAPRAVSTGSVRLFRGGEVSEVAVAQ